MDQAQTSAPEDGRTNANRGLQTQSGESGHPLPSGRTLLISAGENSATDQMQILSPDGRVEVEILLTPNGPVVRVHGGSLSMTSTKSLHIESAGNVEIQAEELRVRTTRSIHLDGETIRLNCQNTPVTPLVKKSGLGCCEKESASTSLSLPDPDQS